MAWPLHYPGGVPDDSFLFTGDDWMPLVEPPSTRGRTALLACGSNASPERLTAKFAGSGIDPTMPVARARVADLASVYSRHVSRYGAIPATPMRRPGVESELFVQFVDADQRALIIHSERRSYELVQLDPTVHRVTLRSGAVVEPVFGFASTAGALALDGAPVGLAAFPATGLVSMTHAELWATLAQRWSSTPATGLPPDAAAVLATLTAGGEMADDVRTAFGAHTTAVPLDLVVLDARPVGSTP